MFIDDRVDNIEVARKRGWNVCMSTGCELDKIKEKANDFFNFVWLVRKSNEETNLITKINKIEDKDSTKEEPTQIENDIIEYIYSKISKNVDIQKANEEYSIILEKITS